MCPSKTNKETARWSLWKYLRLSCCKVRHQVFFFWYFVKAHRAMMAYRFLVDVKWAQESTCCHVWVCAARSNVFLSRYTAGTKWDPGDAGCGWNQDSMLEDQKELRFGSFWMYNWTGQLQNVLVLINCVKSQSLIPPWLLNISSEIVWGELCIPAHPTFTSGTGIRPKDTNQKRPLIASNWSFRPSLRAASSIDSPRICQRSTRTFFFLCLFQSCHVFNVLLQRTFGLQNLGLWISFGTCWQSVISQSCIQVQCI